MALPNFLVTLLKSQTQGAARDALGAASGATGARPTGAAVGTPFFDTTLGKPVFLKTAPSTWVDATGTAA